VDNLNILLNKTQKSNQSFFIYKNNLKVKKYYKPMVRKLKLTILFLIFILKEMDMTYILWYNILIIYNSNYFKNNLIICVVFFIHECRSQFICNRLVIIL